MNAMILAAGRGTRLGELGRTRPKVLVDFCGEPLLARQIRYLKEGGIERIVINAHHLADQVQVFVAANAHAADIDVVVEPALLGTAGGVVNALTRLGDEAFVVLYGDVIMDEPIDLLADTHRRGNACATLTVYRSSEVDGKGTVEFAADGRVIGFQEKGTSHLDGHAYVNAGLYVVDPSLVRPLRLGVPVDFGHDVFPSALAQGLPLMAHVLPEPVIDIGTPAMLDKARALDR
jgi:NDP-sugar pyrophosphorylase family protein